VIGSVSDINVGPLDKITSNLKASTTKASNEEMISPFSAKNHQEIEGTAYFFIGIGSTFYFLMIFCEKGALCIRKRGQFQKM